ncbi:hypothetical protein [Microtetraspora fusca]|uniref:hypothetical protein n=1 Tax=Microtetraspora fusca TaxID=1997 RepID=UPI00083090D5|nr:hypothetical protein [Microtetraspora fusca]
MNQPDELRLLVREVLRELLPAVLPALAAQPAGGGRSAAPSPGPVVEPVAAGPDGDLTAFVLRVLDLAADPARAADIRAGRLRFRLTPPESAPPGSAPENTSADAHAAPEAAPPATGVPAGSTSAGAAPEAVHRREKGAVTERHVAAAAAAGARLVLGPRAVLTPLARERVRATGLVVEREG